MTQPPGEPTKSTTRPSLRTSWASGLAPLLALVLGTGCSSGDRSRSTEENPDSSPHTDAATAKGPPRCPTGPTAVASGDHPTILSFEGISSTAIQSGRIQTPEGIDGAFWSYFDESVQLPLIEVTSPGYESTEALRISFTTLSWGGGWGFDLTDGCLDASAYDGIAMRVRGSGHITVIINAPENTKLTSGGLCEADCGKRDFNAWSGHVGSDWSDVRFTWNDVMGGEPRAPLNPEMLIALSVFIDGPLSSGSVDLWIDDIRFFQDDVPSVDDPVGGGGSSGDETPSGGVGGSDTN